MSILHLGIINLNCYNGKDYAAIEVECDFEEKELDISRNLYDTVGGISSYIKDLKTLHEILNARYIAGYKKKIRLSSFKIFNNRLYLDTCGNVGVRKGEDEGEYSSYSMGVRLPREEDTCKCCGEKWTLYNMFDLFEDHNGNLLHKQCYFLHNMNNKKREFIEAFKPVYEISELDIDVIKNQYSDYEGYAPWFVFHTPDGDIKIGWRKRVINIEWMEDYKPFNEAFDSEGDITRGFGYLGSNHRFIHAYGYDKVSEYLKRARETIV